MHVFLIMQYKYDHGWEARFKIRMPLFANILSTVALTFKFAEPGLGIGGTRALSLWYLANPSTRT